MSIIISGTETSSFSSCNNTGSTTFGTNQLNRLTLNGPNNQASTSNLFSNSVSAFIVSTDSNSSFSVAIRPLSYIGNTGIQTNSSYDLLGIPSWANKLTLSIAGYMRPSGGETQGIKARFILADGTVVSDSYLYGLTRNNSNVAFASTGNQTALELSWDALNTGGDDISIVSEMLKVPNCYRAGARSGYDMWVSFSAGTVQGAAWVYSMCDSTLISPSNYVTGLRIFHNEESVGFVNPGSMRLYYE